MGNTRVLLTENNQEYIWDYTAAISLLKQYVHDNKQQKITQQHVYSDLAKQCYLTTGSVKNWFERKNGPGDIEYVHIVAKHLHVNYHSLLKPLRKELTTSSGKCLFNNSTNGYLSIQAIKLISILNELAEKTSHGYMPFSAYNYSSDFSGILFVDTNDDHYGEIILDMCVDEYHHDVISTYENYLDEPSLEIRAETDIDANTQWITVNHDSGMSITIENGRWYLA